MGLKTAAVMTAIAAPFITSAQEGAMKKDTLDRAAVATIVESVGALADRSEFDALARLFAETFTLDYASLNGQPATVKTPFALMGEWAGVLPGFDRTRHALSDIDVQVSGKTATARAQVVADHWVDGAHWQAAGRYDYELAKLEDRWKITSMVFTLERERGSRAVFGPAIEAAKKKRLPGYRDAVAVRNKRTVRAFFKTLEEGDIPAFVEFFAEDGVQANPYHGGVFPAGAKGKAELSAYWAPIPAQFNGMRFLIDELLATENPSVVFVRYRGEIKLKSGAGVYKNHYYSTFRFNDAGQIAEYVEIFDPVVAARGFGLLDRLK